jgi:hypothetical protein
MKSKSVEDVFENDDKNESSKNANSKLDPFVELKMKVEMLKKTFSNKGFF